MPSLEREIIQNSQKNKNPAVKKKKKKPKETTFQILNRAEETKHAAVLCKNSLWGFFSVSRAFVHFLNLSGTYADNKKTSFGYIDQTFVQDSKIE